MKIEILQPFNDAFELMKRILFRPFDLKKWCVIGFASFLCGHFGGGGFNFRMPLGDFHAASTNRNLPDSNFFEQWKPWLPWAMIGLSLIILILVPVFTWLKARGSFIFTDCIVRNRGAIVEPWREYRREGNSYFLFSLAIFFVSLLMVGIAALLWFVLGGSEPDAVFILIFVGIFMLVWLPAAVFVAVVSYFMVPVMYVHRCLAMDAFRVVFRLVVSNAKPFILFCLFGIVLLFGVMIVGAIVTCATCCLAALPYVGSVVMLPAFLWLRGFGLLFLRQFGPDYDVFARSTSPLAPEPPPLPA